MKPKIAVLALQGDYERHIRVLAALGADAYGARLPGDIARADGVILPGGESTTIGKLMARYGLDTALREASNQGMPIYGTCAGMILLASGISDGTGEQGGQQTLGLLDITVSRNAFGRQKDSFEAEVPIPQIGEPPVRAVFIRAPYAARVGADVEVLATYEGKAVFVRQGNILGSAFHPELTDDHRIHQLFLSMIAGREKS